MKNSSRFGKVWWKRARRRRSLILRAEDGRSLASIHPSEAVGGYHVDVHVVDLTDTASTIIAGAFVRSVREGIEFAEKTIGLDDIPARMVRPSDKVPLEQRFVEFREAVAFDERMFWADAYADLLCYSLVHRVKHRTHLEKVEGIERSILNERSRNEHYLGPIGWPLDKLR